jgi:DHA1 family tetracycline resistance protein-like MFS transporter
MSDRYGRRPVLILSQIGSALGYVLLGVASIPGWWDPQTRIALVYISRVIDGFTGGNVSTAQAYISDVTTSDNRARGMGLLGAAFGIGFCLGPFMGGVLGAYNVSWPAYAAAFLAATAAGVTFFTLRESRVHNPTASKLWLHPKTFVPVLKKPVVSPLLWIAFASMAAYVMMECTIGLFLAKIWHLDDPRLAARYTGWFFGYVGLVIVIVQGGLIGRLTRGLGEWRLAIIGPVCVAIGLGIYISFAWWPSLLILALAGGINALGRSLQSPTVSSLLSKYNDPAQQGVAFGLYHGMSSLARVIGPILAGLTYPLWRNTGPFWTSGTIILLVGIATFILRKRAETIQPAPLHATAVDSAAVAEIE